MNPVTALIPREHLNEPPDPIRASMNEEKMEELVRSIKDHGVMMPLLVFPVEPERWIHCLGNGYGAWRDYITTDGRFEIIDGHRRYIATGRVGLQLIECKVFETAEDAKFGMMLDANYIREDVTPAEEGLLFLELTEKRGWSLEQLCSKFHKSPTYIQTRVDIVQKDTAVCQAVAERRINITQAQVILKQKNPQYRAYMLEQAVVHGASVRTLQYFIDQWKAQEAIEAGGPHPMAPVEATPPPAVEIPPCIYCGKSDEPQHLQQVNIHWYHKKDLQRFIEQVRSHPVVTP